MKLDPVSLKLFIAVAEEGSIARAGAREHIAPAAVSKRMAELETVLRAPLLMRNWKGVVPTDAGLTLLRLARHAVHTLDDTYTQMLEYAEGARGPVRVYANISAITQFLPDDLATFAQAHPQVQILLEERNSTSVTRAVADNAADIGICTLLPHDDSLEQLAYETDELVVVLRKDHPLARRASLTLADVVDWDFVGLREGSAINGRVSDAAAALGRTPKVRVHVTGFDALCLMVGAGMGIAIAPRHAARFYAADLRLGEVALKEPWARRGIGICVRSMAGLSPAGRLLVGHLQRRALLRGPVR